MLVCVVTRSALQLLWQCSAMYVWVCVSAHVMFISQLSQFQFKAPEFDLHLLPIIVKTLECRLGCASARWVGRTRLSSPAHNQHGVAAKCGWRTRFVGVACDGRNDYWFTVKIKDAKLLRNSRPARKQIIMDTVTGSRRWWGKWQVRWTNILSYSERGI